MGWLDKAIEVCSKLGRAIFGEFWLPIIRDTAQDAIGAYIVLSIGGYAGRLIAGKDFSGFAACLKELQTDQTSVTPYVCYGMVALDFALWGAVLARLLYRALLQLTPTPVRQHLNLRWEKFLEKHQKSKVAKSAQPGGGQHGKKP